MTSSRISVLAIAGAVVLLVCLVYHSQKNNPEPAVLVSPDSSVELTLSERTVTLLNLVEESPSRAVPALKKITQGLPLSLLNIVLKTSLLRSLGKDDSPYLSIIYPYRHKCFPLFEELKTEKIHPIQLLRLYGDVYVDKVQGGWTTQMSSKEKEFLFSSLLHGLKDTNLTEAEREERYKVRACALGLVGIVADASSSTYLRELIRSETWSDNITTAKETLRKLQ